MMPIVNDLRPPPIIKNPEERMKILVEKTKNVTIEYSVPIKRYFSSERELLRIANTYLDEMNLEKAFLFYMKYITLYLEKLPSHPQYNNADEADKKLVRSRFKQLFLLAEECKTRIKNKYQKEYEDYLVKKKEYELKLEQVNKSLAEQREKDHANRQNEMLEDYLANFQFQIDKKKRELSEKKDKNISDEENRFRSTNQDKSGDESCFLTSSNKIVPSSSQSAQKPFFDRSTKPSISLLDDFDKETLRQLIVPFKVLTDKFIKIAQNNTDRNIETCGILCGRLKQGRFTITHILIPKQTGTSDSCTSINEEDLTCEQEKYNLITLGWIHTHPTQRSFLSSIDLHTHALYQKMLPEAIAIVVAPTTKEICMYSLTEYGLEYILKCSETGFHPHANEQNLYQTAEHVLMDDSLILDLIDLR